MGCRVGGGGGGGGGSQREKRKEEEKEEEEEEEEDKKEEEREEEKNHQARPSQEPLTGLATSRQRPTKLRSALARSERYVALENVGLVSVRESGLYPHSRDHVSMTLSKRSASERSCHTSEAACGLGWWDDN